MKILYFRIYSVLYINISKKPESYIKINSFILNFLYKYNSERDNGGIDDVKKEKYTFSHYTVNVLGGEDLI